MPFGCHSYSALVPSHGWDHAHSYLRSIVGLLVECSLPEGKDIDMVLAVSLVPGRCQINGQ